MARNFRFGHQDEDADDGSEFVVSTPVRRKRWKFVCSWCSHLNPARLDDCEQCGEERPEE